MARTAVTPAQLVSETVVAPTSTTINSTLVTNGVTIAAAHFGHILIRVANSDTNPHNLIIRAGTDLTPVWRKGLGDLTVAVSASATGEMPPIESARYKQSDGSLSIDFSTGFTGTLETTYLP